jgi:hypothetical protein
MQTGTATATAPKSARELLFGEQQSGVLQEDINLNAPRFFVQLGWNQLDVDTQAIPYMRLLRGEITPCRTFRQKANIVEIREADLIPGSEEQDKDGRTVYGYYRRFAWYEAERLVELEARAERQTGLYEVTALRGELGAEVYRKVNLNTLFFPTWPALPEKNADVIAALEARVAELKANEPQDMPPHYLPIIYKVGEQLIEAAKRADAVQRHLLTYTHSCMKLTPKDEAFKRQYDDVDYEMLARTGIPQIHAAEIQTAQALEKLTDRTTSDNDGLRQMMTLMQQQMEQQARMIELLMAERNGKAQQTSQGKPNANSK